MSEEQTNKTLTEENAEKSAILTVDAAGAASAEENKSKNRIIAITVGAVVLLFILIVTMIYQMIAVTGRKNEVLKLKADIAELQQTYEQGEETLDARKQRWYIERRARELGYAYADDIVLD